METNNVTISLYRHQICGSPRKKSTENNALAVLKHFYFLSVIPSDIVFYSLYCSLA